MRYIVNDNGEVLKTIEDHEEFTTLGIGDRVIRRDSYKLLSDVVTIDYGKFVKLNPDVCREVCKYGPQLFLLFEFVNFQTNILTWKNGRFVRPKQLAGILRKKRRSGNDIINKLISEDIIHKHRDGRTYFYVMNPYICIKGREIPKKIYEEFKNTKYRHLIGEVDD